MADKTIDSERFYLYDRWPGVPFSGADLPTDGFTGTSHNNVTTAAYPVGTKIAVFNTSTTGVSGGSTLIYLQCQEIQATCPFRAKTWVTPNVIDKYYQVTNSATSLCDTGAPAAACVGTNGVATAAWSTTTGRFGWFWCGGVAPEAFVTNMGGNYVTDSTVVAGPACLSNLGTTTTTSGGLALQARVSTASCMAVAVCSTADAA